MSVKRAFQTNYMPNYKLEELLSKSNDEVRSIAQSLGINAKQSDSQQDIAYMIIDEQAIQNTQSVNEQRRAKRPRIGESAAKPKEKKKAATKAASEPKQEAEPQVAANVNTEAVIIEGEVQSEPKRRGRPRKNAQPATETQEESAATEGVVQSEPKRRGRPRKSEQPAPEAQVESASLFDQEAMASAEPKQEAEPAVQQPAQSVADAESDFVILQDIPSVEAINEQLNAVPQPAADGALQDGANSDTAADLANRSLAQAEHRANLETTHAVQQPYDFGEAIIGSGVLEITPE